MLYIRPCDSGIALYSILIKSRFLSGILHPMEIPTRIKKIYIYNILPIYNIIIIYLPIYNILPKQKKRINSKSNFFHLSLKKGKDEKMKRFSRQWFEKKNESNIFALSFTLYRIIIRLVIFDTNQTNTCII